MGKIKYKFYVVPLFVIILFYVFLKFIGINTTCYFKSITGIPCPGCGLTRAYLSLMHENIKKAFFYHPLFILPILIFIYISLCKFKKVKYSNKLLGIVLVAFIGLWIVRMILFFPSTEPMDFDSNTLFPKIIKHLSRYI
jgi:hypothetical protein